MVAAPAFAEVQNVQVSGTVDSTFLLRRNFDLGDPGSAGSAGEQALFFTQTTLRVDADLTDQVTATIALINERVWNNDGGTDVGIDLLLAYVQMREMLYSPLTVEVGRMNHIRFGNSFIFDATGSNNVADTASGLESVANDMSKATGIDGIHLIFDYNPLTIDVMYFVLESDATLTADDTDTDVYLVGLNANYALGDDMDTVVEGYFWYRGDKSDRGGTGGEKTDVLKIVGSRVGTSPFEGWYFSGEFAWQTGVNAGIGGDTDNRRRDAYGVQLIANWQVPAYDEYDPVLQYVFTKVTGNATTDAADLDDFTGWDPFFENQGGGTIYNTLFNLTNAYIHELSLSTKPMEDLTAKLSLTGIWLERELDPETVIAIRQPDDGGTPTLTLDAGTADSQHLGKEIDFELLYDYTEDVQLGLALGWFIPQGAFSNLNDRTAKQLIANVNVAF